MNNNKRDEHEEKNAEVTTEEHSEESPKKPHVKGKRLTTGVRGGAAISSITGLTSWSCSCNV